MYEAKKEIEDRIHRIGYEIDSLKDFLKGRCPKSSEYIERNTTLEIAKAERNILDWSIKVLIRNEKNRQQI